MKPAHTLKTHHISYLTGQYKLPHARVSRELRDFYLVYSAFVWHFHDVYISPALKNYKYFYFNNNLLILLEKKLNTKKDETMLKYL